MRDFLKSRRFKVIIVILCFLFGLMVYSATSGGRVSPFEMMLQYITQPVASAATAVSSGVRGGIGKVINADRYKSENDELRRELSELRAKIMDYDDLKNENEALRKMVKIVTGEGGDVAPEFAPPGTVISREANDIFGGFTINQGKSGGVKPGDPVLTDIGLVGVINEVGPTFSRVTTLLSTETRVGVITLDKHTIGVIENDAKYAKDGLCLMNYIEKDSNIKKGDVVVTAGGVMFPGGIIVGEVEEVFPDPNGLQLHALIKPSENIYDVNTVYIMTKFNGQGLIPDDPNPSDTGTSDTGTSETGTSEPTTTTSTTATTATTTTAATTAAPN